MRNSESHDDGSDDHVSSDRRPVRERGVLQPLDLEVPEVPNPEKHHVFILTVQMGLEEQVKYELEIILAPHPSVNASFRAPWPIRGYVGVFLPTVSAGDPSCELLEACLMRMRSINDVLRYHLHMKLPVCEDPKRVPVALYEDLASRCRENPSLIPTMLNKPTFRVTSSRCGDHHSFSSKDIEMEAGGALQEAYDAKPKMRHGLVNVRVDVVASVVIIGTQINNEELSRRHKKAFLNRVTIKSNIAYIMLQMAGLKKGMSILDPFCGSGTILLEAAEVTEGNLNGFGTDTILKTVNGATSNAKVEGFTDCLKFSQRSAVSLSSEFEQDQFDVVVTNPPWGIETGKNCDLRDLYRKFLSASWRVTKPGGRVVAFVLQAMMFLDIVRSFGQFALLQVKVVKTRNNLPSIFVLERLPNDSIYNDLKTQLYELGNFVNIPPHIFKKIHESPDESRSR